jgi:hypothetical protein
MPSCRQHIVHTAEHRHKERLGNVPCGFVAQANEHANRAGMLNSQIARDDIDLESWSHQRKKQVNLPSFSM